MLILNIILISIQFLTCKVMSARSTWPAWTQPALPSTYLGNTLYMNQTFNSVNITTALRIQRDIAMNVTIDRLVWPALELSTAYFGKDYSLRRLSTVDQVLVMGYKRLVVDLYWNSVMLDWQLCPYQFNISIYVTTAAEDSSITNPDIYLEDGYVCALKYTFADFLNSINDYLISTEANSVSSLTNLVTLILNLHDSIGVNSTAYTGEKTLTNLGDIILNTITKTTGLSPRIYTPSNLTTDKANVSATFFADEQEIYLLQQQQQSTIDWPQWIYLVERKVQLLVGFGNVDTNASFEVSAADQNVIFDSLGSTNISSLDFQNNTSCVGSPQSWDFVNDQQGPFTYQTALNMTFCGHSPYFTHSNYSDSISKYSNVDSGHLADNVLSTIWSWDINQPDVSSNGRCAAIQKNNGRWKVNNCAQPLRAACRSNMDANSWILTKDFFSYDRSLSACPSNYTFDVPRVPIQNAVLRDIILAENIEGDAVWINLNLAYNSNGCWVVGRYGTCWWTSTNGNQYLGLIKTSIVAGIIILILVGIFAWVKCARLWRNRNSRARKAMIKAMLKRREYVTVPA